MKRLTTDEFIDRAKCLHGDAYDYKNVLYVNMHTNVDIVCPIHGVFHQTPSNHLKGHGCLKCTKIANRRTPLSDFIDRSDKIHNCKYDYSNVDYINNKTKVEIVCPLHGSFMQTPEKHLHGRGCPKCAPNCPDTKETFVEKARVVHGDMYDYSKVEYINSSTKVCIIDRQYGEFWQKPNAHLRGEGHPLRKPEKCYKTKKANNSFNTSKAEDSAKALLIQKFGEKDVKVHYSTDLYPFACDFYIESLDLYIELNIYVTHGGHWFDSTDADDIARLTLIRERSRYRNMYSKMIEVWTHTDLLKRDTAIKNGLNYLVFWDNNLSDFLEWYDHFDETHILKQF